MLYLLAFHVPFLDQWVLIALVALLLFGGKKLPEMGRSLGKGIVEFKKGLKGIHEDIESVDTVPDTGGSSKPVTQYKFDPETGQPVTSQASALPPGAKFDPYTGKPITQSLPQG